MKNFLWFLLVCLGSVLYGQDSTATDSVDQWDNQLFFSNKAAWSKGNWRYSGEFQIRLNDNTTQLNSYLIEGSGNVYAQCKMGNCSGFEVYC